ncbi:DUF808 domain-containing protein [Sphingomonas montanisoli]|uniref:DUF808 domain-containing protein n=1 Tax=Sphingomonas montanisoli TaxID=2606412 RepID=A0A5D9CE02_9SPHN|nr:DUF808 domain-containing protein [Sphingomonas montanisoli]TZG29586.1 DUF808 domain-containing protein [Sphingomonas montanisoli]
MATGLIALLDDVAGIAKLAAASLDDVAGAAGKAGAKAAGVVVDDTAVTPSYVVGLTPERELPIIWKIALGSARNKLLLLLPAALLLSAFAPWAITPILMLGGLYLCFEGAEKVWEAVSGASHETEAAPVTDPVALEKERVSGAIRTDLILSAEIMAIALAEVGNLPLLTQAIALAAVGLAITVVVYGVVGILVKMDDIGLHLARRAEPLRSIGDGLVRMMPVVFRIIATVGTAAMIWVGGGIIVHGLEQLGWPQPAHMIEALAGTAASLSSAGSAVIHWVVTATASGILGLVAGIALAGIVHMIAKARH